MCRGRAVGGLGPFFGTRRATPGPRERGNHNPVAHPLRVMMCLSSGPGCFWWRPTTAEVYCGGSAFSDEKRFFRPWPRPTAVPSRPQERPPDPSKACVADVGVWKNCKRGANRRGSGNCCAGVQVVKANILRPHAQPHPAANLRPIESLLGPVIHGISAV